MEPQTPRRRVALLSALLSLLVLAVLSLAACDPASFSDFLVDNQSGRDLVLRLEPTRGDPVTVDLPSGRTVPVYRTAALGTRAPRPGAAISAAVLLDAADGRELARITDAAAAFRLFSRGGGWFHTERDEYRFVLTGRLLAALAG